jgi:hypothetical protein
MKVRSTGLVVPLPQRRSYCMDLADPNRESMPHVVRMFPFIPFGKMPPPEPRLDVEVRASGDLRAR